MIFHLGFLWMFYRACKCWWTVSYQWMMNCGPCGMTVLFIEFVSYIISIQGPTVYLPTQMMKVSQTNFWFCAWAFGIENCCMGLIRPEYFFVFWVWLSAYHGTSMLSERFPWFVVVVSWQPDGFPKAHPNATTLIWQFGSLGWHCDAGPFAWKLGTRTREESGCSNLDLKDESGTIFSTKERLGRHSEV